MFETNRPDVRLLVLRGVSLHTLNAVALILVSPAKTRYWSGSDMLCEPVDLQLSKCRLMTATKKGSELPTTGRIQVATKYVNVARRYFASQGRQIDQLSFMERWNWLRSWA